MKKFLCIFITVIVTIIVLIGAIVVYLWFANPLGLRDVAKSMIFKTDVKDMDTNFDHPLLNVEQESSLRNSGIDPAKLPTSLTPEQEKCASEALGAERTKELLSGTAPGAMDIIKLAPCLK